MALIYRAIWQEDRENLPGVSAASMLDWLRRKGIQLDVDALPEGVTGGTFTDPRFGTDATFDLSVWCASADGIQALRAALAETRPGEGRQWTTTLTVLSSPGAAGILWVDVEVFSDDPFQRVSFRAPALVKTLILEGREPRVGHIRLESGPRAIAATALGGLVRNEQRKLPLIVFSHDRAGAQVTLDRAQQAFDRLAGVAQVYVLPPDEVDEFKTRVGDDLAVWGGAARLYLPNSGPAGLRPERHRYVSGARAARAPWVAAEIFAAMLSATVPATPAPVSYARVRHLLTGAAGGDADELLAIADEDIANLERELQQLREHQESRDDEIIDQVAEIEELSEENNRLAAQLAALRSGASAVEAPGDDREPPATVSTIAEAVECGRLLPNLAVHRDAPVDIDKLDSAVNAPGWANRIWRALRALDAYAGDHVAGGFWKWCKEGNSPWSWPASDKKLAMSESEGVLANRDLRAARLLPVDPVVEPTGRVEMLAHLKIAEGGGPLAPRIYFYDDTAGPTGKVHVGFLGPHEHMPNMGTN